jgi:hypothetical protein
VPGMSRHTDRDRQRKTATLSLSHRSCFSSASLLAELTDSVEQSLWNSIRAIEERIRLLKHLKEHSADIASNTETNSALNEDLQEAEEQADSVRAATMRINAS